MNVIVIVLLLLLMRYHLSLMIDELSIVTIGWKIV